METPGQSEDLLVAELRRRLDSSFKLLQAVIQIRLRAATDPESRRHLSWLLDVVTALAMLQQRVGLAGPVDFGAYLIEAATYWRRLLEGRPIDVVLDARATEVSETQAATLALITHELVSNCVEHAFPGGRKGVIQIGWSERPNGMRELMVRDDGCGFAEGEDGAHKGLELVRGLAAHLGGGVRVDESVGVTVRVLIPREEGPRPN